MDNSYNIANISQPPVDVCLGNISVFYCSVSGNNLLWRYDDDNNIFSRSVCNNQELGQYFQTELISICDGVVRSRAALNVSSSNVTESVNGTVIKCANASAGSESNVTINLNVNSKYYTPINVMQAPLHTVWVIQGFVGDLSVKKGTYLINLCQTLPSCPSLVLQARPFLGGERVW